MSPQEPSVLLQKMPAADAMKAKEQLDGGGYWEFWCRNTGQGSFEVLKFKAISSSVRLD
jgi:hypothetical protein